MKKLFAKVPLGCSAIALSLAVLGNILGPTSPFRNYLGALSLIFVVIVIIKIALDFESFQTEMKNPIALSSFSTFSMSLSVLISYVPNLPIFVLRLVWFLALFVHIAIIVLTTQNIILNRKVFPSYYVAFVGVVSFTVTSKVVALLSLGNILLWFGFVCFILLTPFVFKTIFTREVPQPALPTRAIVAAPLSLFVVGYFSVTLKPAISFITFTHSIAMLLYLFGLYFVIRTIKKEPNPTIAAWTFPMTISTLATLRVKSLYVEGALNPAYTVLFNVQLTICCIVIAIAIIQYVRLIVASYKTK